MPCAEANIHVLLRRWRSPYSTKIEIIINLITAKLLSLSFPLALLARADEMIE